MISVGLTSCSGLTIGPRTETEYLVIGEEGPPLRSITSAVIEGEVLHTNKIVKQNIAGWIFMHPNHYRAWQRERERLLSYIERLKKGEYEFGGGRVDGEAAK